MLRAPIPCGNRASVAFALIHPSARRNCPKSLMSEPVSLPSGDSSPRRRTPRSFRPLLGPRHKHLFEGGLARTLDPFHAPSQNLLYPVLALVLPPVTAVRPRVLRARERFAGVLQERLDPPVIHHLGAVDLRFEHEALGVYPDMSLSALHLLAAVVSSLLSSHARAPERPVIHHAGARTRIPSDAHAQTLAQGGVQPLPGTVEAPGPEVVVDGLPGRKLVGQQAPGTSATQHVEDGVEDLPQGMDSRAAGSLRDGEVRLYAGPLGVGKVGLVCSSHAR